MLYNNLKIFIRHLRANKLYAFISIFSFAVSLMFVILLGVYIHNEISVDNFHNNKDRIYRLTTESSGSKFAPPCGSLLKGKFPEIESYVRTRSYGCIASLEGRGQVRMSSLITDSTFFKVFSFRLFKGSPETALIDKHSLVLSKSGALKLFGKIPDIGSQVTIYSETFNVTGIMEDFPDNTHFGEVDCLMNFWNINKDSRKKYLFTSYEINIYGLYLMTYKNTDIQSKVPSMKSAFKEVDCLYKDGHAKELFAEPLEDVYFSSKYGQGTKHGNIMLVNVLVVIVLLILLLSITNYVNLTISQSGSRSKGAAIRKLVGGKKWSFVFQYVSESVILCLFSMCLALIMSVFAEPVVNNLLDTQLHLQDAFTWQFWIIVILFAIFVGVLSGILPALKIASLNPISVVKGTFRIKEKRVYSRLLICFQYIIIISLLISAIFINKQIKYMQNFNLKFNKENIISLDNRGINPSQNLSFKSKILQYAGVEDVSLTRGTPLNGGLHRYFKFNNNSFNLDYFSIDTSFFNILDIDIRLTGVAYSDDIVFLNQTAAKKLELPENATTVKIEVGKYSKEHPVYGIVDDFHFKDLHSKVGIAFFDIYSPKKGYVWDFIIKLNGKNTLETINKIKETYADFSGGLKPNIDFFDETIARWYSKEEKLGKIIMYFMLLTIIISVMGLFAMSMYYVHKKTKEIGIRKVNGATSRELLTLLNRDFVTWVFIAFIIAVPISYYAMNKWLEDFAYKINLSWWIFALSGIFALFIALLTVSWQSYQAASRNPVKSLRYE